MEQKPTHHSLLLKTLRNEPTPRPPVWFMRQAGRSLKSYQKLKAQYNFRTLLHTPELAAEVTLLPIHDLGVDAAIVFSDILVIAAALGFTTSFNKIYTGETVGPKILSPLKESTLKVADYPYNPEQTELQALRKTLKLIKNEVPTCPLIGFCGAPLTLFLYLFEGKGGSFTRALEFITNEPELFDKWMHHLTDCSIHYAQLQIESGIDVFQIFESWAGLIPHELYLSSVMPHIVRLARAIRKQDIPVIYFPRLFAKAYSRIPIEEFDAISLDSQISLTEAHNALCKQSPTTTKAKEKAKTLDKKIVLQGNLNPQLILELPPDQLTEYLEQYLTFFNEYPHWIVNLGHGVIPETPESSLRLTIETLKKFSYSPPSSS